MRKFIAIAMFVIAALLGMSSKATAQSADLTMFSEEELIQAARRISQEYEFEGIFVLFKSGKEAERVSSAKGVAKTTVHLLATDEKLAMNVFHGGENQKDPRSLVETPGVLNIACYSGTFKITKKRKAWVAPVEERVTFWAPVDIYRVAWIGTESYDDDIARLWKETAELVRKENAQKAARLQAQAMAEMLEAIANRIDALDHSFVAPIPTPAQPELTERPEITFTVEATVAFVAIFCMLIGFVVIRRRREEAAVVVEEEEEAVELAPAQDTCPAPAPAPAPVTCDYTFETFAVVAPEAEVVVEAEKLDVVEFAVYAVNSSVAESAADAVVVGGLANILEILRDIAVEEVVAEEEHAETSEEDVCGELAAPTLMTASLGIVVVTVLTSLIWATEHRRRGAPMPRPPP